MCTAPRSWIPFQPFFCIVMGVKITLRYVMGNFDTSLEATSKQVCTSVSLVSYIPEQSCLCTRPVCYPLGHCLTESIGWRDSLVHSVLGLVVPGSIPSLGKLKHPSSSVTDLNIKLRMPSHRVTLSMGHVSASRTSPCGTPWDPWVTGSVGQFLCHFWQCSGHLWGTCTLLTAVLSWRCEEEDHHIC